MNKNNDKESIWTRDLLAGVKKRMRIYAEKGHSFPYRGLFKKTPIFIFAKLFNKGAFFSEMALFEKHNMSLTEGVEKIEESKRIPNLVFFESGISIILKILLAIFVFSVLLHFVFSEVIYSDITMEFIISFFLFLILFIIVLHSVIQFPNHYIRCISKNISSEMTKGKNLSEAMRRFKKIFKPYEIAIISAGERSGNLYAALKMLGKYNTLLSNIYRIIIRNIAYPILLLMFLCLVGTFILTKIIPNFSRIYYQLDVELPRCTRMVIHISDIINHSPIFNFSFININPVIAAFITILGPILLIIAVIYFIRSLRYLQYLILPLRRLLEGKMLILLGLQLEKEVPIDEAVSNFAQLQSDYFLNRTIRKIFKNITQGKSLAESLKDNIIISPRTIAKLTLSEHSGEPGSDLIELGMENIETAQYSLVRFSTFLEPVLHICIAIIIGFVVISFYLPMFDIPISVH